MDTQSVPEELVNHAQIPAPTAGNLAATVPNMNHTQDTAPALTPMLPAVLTLEALMAKREQLIQGLNGARAQLEMQAQSVTRTEGALMMVNQMITELDPTALQQQGE